MTGTVQSRLLGKVADFCSPLPILPSAEVSLEHNGASVNRHLPRALGALASGYPRNWNSGTKRTLEPIRLLAEGVPSETARPVTLGCGSEFFSAAGLHPFAATAALPRSARQQTRRRILATARQSQPARRRRCSQQQQHLCGPLRVSQPRARRWVARYVVLVGRDVGSASERKVKRMGRNPAP